jgi:hypothetical protein
MTENYTTGNQPSNGYSNFCRSKTSKLKIRPGAVTITKAPAGKQRSGDTQNPRS